MNVTRREVRLELGRLIREGREAAGLTQEDLGGKLNPSVTQQTVSRWERGETSPRTRKLGAVSRALGLPSGEILSRLLEAFPDSLE